MKAQPCPICHGKTLVPRDFYAVGTSIPIDAQKCRSCDGKGYILVPEAQPFTPYIGDPPGIQPGVTVTPTYPTKLGSGQLWAGVRSDTAGYIID